MVSAGADSTSALAAGGYYSPPATRAAETESWNGTNWTAVNALNTGRSGAAGNGIITSALYYGGYDTTQRAYTESWNGTNWTEVNDLNTARYNLGGVGANNTSALAFGGTPLTANTELWTGAAWTEVADLSVTREDINSSDAGTTTAALVAGGTNPPGVIATTEEWNGSSTTTKTVSA